MSGKILLLDIGNTSIDIGILTSTLIYSKKLPRQNFLSIYPLLERFKPTRAVFCSVVPQLSRKIRVLLKKKGVKIYECGKEITVPIRNRYRKPHQVGQDRLLNAFSASKLFKEVRVVIDLGTALTFDFISSRGEYLGGLIFPGLRLSLNSLLKECALLPSSLDLHWKEFKKKDRSLIGRDTEECIEKGIILGYVFFIREVIRQVKKRNKNARSLITGGDAQFLGEKTEGVDYIEPFLSLRGLVLLANSLISDR